MSKKRLIIGVAVFMVFACIILALVMQPKTSAAGGTIFMVYPGVDLTPDEVASLVGNTFAGYPNVLIGPSGDQRAAISYIPTDGGDTVPFISVPTGEGFVGTDFENSVLTEGGVGGAQSAVILQLVGKQAFGKLPEVDLGVPLREQYMVIMEGAMERLPEGDLLAALTMTHMQLDYDRQAELTEQAIEGLVVANNNLATINSELIADGQHERETWATEANDSRNDILAAVAIVEGAVTARGFFAFAFLAVILLGLYLVLFKPRKTA